MGEEIKPNLAKAIISVMRESTSIDKNTVVGSGRNKYNAVSDKDVKSMLSPLMVKNGLCILPISVKDDTSVTHWEESYNGNTQRKMKVFTKVNTEYLLMHESGEAQVIKGFGHGIDTQDKSAGKATTYALKQLLLYLFMIPTGSIDDTDNVYSENLPIQEEKPWMNEHDYKNVTLEVKEGKIKNIEQIKQKYKLTDGAEKALIKLFQI